MRGARNLKKKKKKKKKGVLPGNDWCGGWCEIPKNRGTQIVGNGIFRDPEGYELSNGCSPGNMVKRWVRPRNRRTVRKGH